MILSGNDVKTYIKLGKLVFNPVLTFDQFQQNGIDMILANAKITLLDKGDFTLGVTREYIYMPDDLMAFVQLRSSWARKGLFIPPTVIDAGFQGTITLEIACFSLQQLPIGQRFAHIIFAKLTNPTEPYNGKYQNQVNITESVL